MTPAAKRVFSSSEVKVGEQLLATCNLDVFKLTKLGAFGMWLRSS